MSRPTRGVPAFVAFMMVLLGCWAAFAQGQVQKLGSLSFAVPEGWKYEQKAGSDFADIVWTNANGAFVVILLTKPIRSSGDADKDFAAAWRAEVEPDPQAAIPSPIYDIRGMMGYPGKWSGGAVDNRTKEVALYVLETGESFVPVVVIAPNSAVLDALHEMVRAVIGSIRAAPLVAVPIQTTINIADLVGDWKYGDASVVSYVNSTTGNYEGSSTTFSGEFYTIAADGSYTFSFQGMTDNHIVREKSAGVVDFSGEFVVFHELPSNKFTRYHFIAYEHGLGGGTLLTLLPEAYEVNSSSIAMYASRFAREPVK